MVTFYWAVLKMHVKLYANFAVYCFLYNVYVLILSLCCWWRSCLIVEHWRRMGESWRVQGMVQSFWGQIIKMHTSSSKAWWWRWSNKVRHTTTVLLHTVFHGQGRWNYPAMLHSPAWKIMNATEHLLVLSICGEELSATDIDTILQHSAGDLDTQLISELQQLRHITTTDDQRVCDVIRNVSWHYAKGTSFIAIVASSCHTREGTLRSSLFYCNAGTLLQSVLSRTICAQL